nr:hypothetical protein GCM10010200_041900 [Actinomadura rugatobispora]
MFAQGGDPLEPPEWCGVAAERGPLLLAVFAQGGDPLEPPEWCGAAAVGLDRIVRGRGWSLIAFGAWVASVFAFLLLSLLVRVIATP